eukprot:scaffold4162_cov162-Amphora_coffeaeformis.AAC.10
MRQISKLQGRLIAGLLIQLLLALDNAPWRSCALVVAAPHPRLYTTAQIDYTGANEYTEAHYGISDYFVGRHKVGDKVVEPILDARAGVIDLDGSVKEPSIELCGFQLVNTATGVTKWEDLDQIRDTYLPQVKSILEDRIYAGSKIRHIIFWNAVRRGERLEQTRPEDPSLTPTANFAAFPHIDTDVNAYSDASQLVDLLEKNCLEGFDREDVVNSLEKGRRFCIVNAWKNIADQPVARAPLALFATRYKSGWAFPDSKPDMNTSKWYVYSNMTVGEILFFCQYDRDVKLPSDVWHCALTGHGTGSRDSFDLRIFVIFDEVVPRERDRFSEDRMRCLLDQEGSGCFCNEQEERRKAETTD